MAKPKKDFGQDNPHDQLAAINANLAGNLSNMKMGIEKGAQIRALERAVDDIKLLLPYLKGIEW